MIKTIIATLLARFAATNVDATLASFNKTIDRLQIIAASHIKVAAEAAQAKAEAEAKELLSRAEADRANAVAAKIKELIGNA
jgi:hypothetical protein